MREKTAIRIKKLHDMLINKNYITTSEIQYKLKCCRQSIYTYIRYLRLQGVGIIATPKGYVLSESASKKDDVHLIRKCFGRRTSDLLTLQTAKPDIDKRWNGVEYKNDIREVMKYLSINTPNKDRANIGMKNLLIGISE